MLIDGGESLTVESRCLHLLAAAGSGFLMARGYHSIHMSMCSTLHVEMADVTQRGEIAVAAESMMLYILRLCYSLSWVKLYVSFKDGKVGRYLRNTMSLTTSRSPEILRGLCMVYYLKRLKSLERLKRELKSKRFLYKIV